MSKSAEQSGEYDIVYRAESSDPTGGRDWFGVVTAAGDYAVHLVVYNINRGETSVSPYRGVVAGRNLRFEGERLRGEADTPPDVAYALGDLAKLPSWHIRPPVTEHAAKEALALSYGAQAIGFVRAYVEAVRASAGQQAFTYVQNREQ